MFYVREASPLEALDLLQPAGDFDTSGGLLTVEDHCDGSRFFAIEQNGRTAGAYALRITEHAAGAACWIVAAAWRLVGLRGTKAVLPMIERQAATAGCKQVAVTTIRPGLIRELERAGYVVTGITLRKRLP